MGPNPAFTLRASVNSSDLLVCASVFYGFPVGFCQQLRIKVFMMSFHDEGHRLNERCRNWEVNLFKKKQKTTPRSSSTTFGTFALSC